MHLRRRASAFPALPRGLRALPLLLLPLTTGCATLFGSGPATPSLREVVDSITTTPPLHRTHWGIEVWDAERARPVLRLNPEDHFVPASNNKLLVTAAALAELGPDWRYRTPLLVSGAPGDTAVAELVVVGRGDPTLSARFHPTEGAPLDSLADSVALAGIRRIDLLAVDATYFDRELVHSSWEVGDLDWYYAAPVAAFGVAEGAIPIHIAPGSEPGAPAVVRIAGPEGRAVVQARVLTDTAGAEEDWSFERRPGTDTLLFSGVLPLDEEPDTVWVTPVDPALHAAVSLRTALVERGIRVGPVRVEYGEAGAVRFEPSPERANTAAQVAGEDAMAPASPADAMVPDRGAHRTIATWTSPPMAEIVAAVLKPSQNWIAEHLLKTLGAEVEGEGSWDAGAEVERRFLFEEVGIDSGAIVIRDASGLSAQNLVTPHALIQLLEHARRQPWGPVYRAALAEPAREGTLERRLEAFAGRLQAKTGTITHVNSLSGYLTTAEGHELTFSVLTNASGRPSSEVRAAIDAIAEAIARGGGR